jgi:hypothetical protein
LTFHAAQLASLFQIYGLVGAASGGLESDYRVGSLESGILLCQTYEAYLELHTPVSISFEHAWFLLLALARRDATRWVSTAARSVAVCYCGICWPDTNKRAAIAIRRRLDERTELLTLRIFRDFFSGPPGFPGLSNSRTVRSFFCDETRGHHQSNRSRFS